MCQVKHRIYLPYTPVQAFSVEVISCLEVSGDGELHSAVGVERVMKRELGDEAQEVRARKRTGCVRPFRSS